MPVPDGGLLVLDFIREDYRIEEWPQTPAGRALTVKAEGRKVFARPSPGGAFVEIEEGDG